MAGRNLFCLEYVGLKTCQPTIEMRTLGPDTGQPNFQYGEHSK